MVRASDCASRAALALLALLSACGDGRGPRGEGYNVLLISLDSTRRDLVGAYGEAKPFTKGAPTELSPSPSLDALAARGVLLREAYATTSWTLPSHLSLLTGEPELVHAVEIDHLRPAPGLRTLATVLRARGYRTAGFYSGPYLDPRFGFAEGFDRYEACYGPELAAASAERSAAYARAAAAARAGDRAAEEVAHGQALEAEVRVEQLSHQDRSSASVADRAAEAIAAAAAAKEPFFVFAHFFDPHYDYVPPEEHDLFDPDYEGPVTGEHFWTNPLISEFDGTRPSGRRRTVDERGLDRVRALYAGDLHWTDAAVGRLLARLDELGVAGRTLVIVTSDHGDEFFEHEGLGHRRTLFEEVVRIPLILRMPGVLPEGVEVDGLTSNHDVFATVLDLLGFPALPGSSSQSFRPLIEGAEPPGERAVLGRLVTARAVQFGARHAGQPVQGQLFTIEETWRQGRIKVRRVRSWPEATNPPPALAAELAAHAEEQRARDILEWIDVERHPDESAGAWSSDFTAALPRAALQAFHDRYTELLRRRAVARTSSPDELPLSGLGGLGYTEGTDAPALESDRFVVEPPGAEILRPHRQPDR